MQKSWKVLVDLLQGFPTFYIDPLLKSIHRHKSGQQFYDNIYIYPPVKKIPWQWGFSNGEHFPNMQIDDYEV